MSCKERADQATRDSHVNTDPRNVATRGGLKIAASMLTSGELALVPLMMKAKIGPIPTPAELSARPNGAGHRGATG